jgi:glycosyltransferase involved in cell wall biosynthesis
VQPPTVLIDGSHFRRVSGTGIASYAFGLATALKQSGCNVAVLFGQRMSAKASGLSIATQVFGHEPPAPMWHHSLTKAGSVARAVLGTSRRKSAQNVPLGYVDLRANDPALPPFDQALNASSIFDDAHQLCARRGLLVSLDAPSTLAAAHWTAPLPIKAKGIPNIYSVHDLVPIQFPYFVLDRNGRMARLLCAIAREADLITTVSEASKRQIVEVLQVPEERISVTYQAVAPLPRIDQEDAERLVASFYQSQAGHYALFLGAIEPKKNLKRLIEAHLLAGTDIPLLIAGPNGWLCEEDLVLIESISGSDRHGPVRRLGYLPRRHVVALLQCARFLAFPSICEGFGLPALEAMQLGVPVLTSNTSSLPEVTGDAAVLVDPLDIADMVRGIRQIANDADLRAELGRRGALQAAKFDQREYRKRLGAAYRTVGVEIRTGDGPCGAAALPDVAGERAFDVSPRG